MSEKKTHFGRAGEFFAMSELLLRGWNVAVPVVDVGDDVFVIDDNDKTTWRLQVKASERTRGGEGEGAARATEEFCYSLSRKQLRTFQPVELFYMLMMRLERSWRFLVIPREVLSEIRKSFVEAEREGPGRPPVADAAAKTDVLTLKLELREGEVRGWGVSLAAYLDQWPEQLSPVVGGPGSLGQDPIPADPGPGAGDAASPRAEAPAPSRDRGS